MKKQLLVAVVTLLVLAGCGGTMQTAPETNAEESPAQQPATDEESSEVDLGERLILATTTSTYDSGLLDAMLPEFEEQTGLTVEVVAVGTGQALSLGEQGDADVLLVHARSREDAFMGAGHGTRREDVMYNDFVILGPPNDPASIAGKASAPEALAQIAAQEAVFISRGDDSGTYTKEMVIWAEAGVEPAGDWYRSIGQGMGATLTMANEEEAYTLSDRGTYLSRSLEEGFGLEVMVEGDTLLFNPYGVITVNPDKNDQINAAGANAFVDWLISLPVQEQIAVFGTERFGSPLFTPDSEAWNASQ